MTMLEKQSIPISPPTILQDHCNEEQQQLNNDEQDS